MPKVYSHALKQEIEVDRYIGKFEGPPELPTVIVLGGIHGNEPSGVFALDRLCNHLRENGAKPSGSLYAIAGNLCALPSGDRYCDMDLNRLWTSSRVKALENGHAEEYQLKEDVQMKQILKEIRMIVARAKGDVIFLDLHTTSSVSAPFMPINDTMANRRLARKVPVPTVLGIEEFLDGPLLSYINELDHIAIGFEGGQHDDPGAIAHHLGFCNKILTLLKIYDKEELPEFDHYDKQLRAAGRKERAIYEIRHRYEVEDALKFEMKPGFRSFDTIEKDQTLASDRGEIIKAVESGKIFMPLYQKLGNDGFFIIRKVHPVWLKLSSLLRKIKFESLLVALPGVQRDPSDEKSILLDRHVARYFSKELFHLLGFRIKSRNADQYRFTRREKL